MERSGTNRLSRSQRKCVIIIMYAQCCGSETSFVRPTTTDKKHIDPSRILKNNGPSRLVWPAFFFLHVFLLIFIYSPFSTTSVNTWKDESTFSKWERWSKENFYDFRCDENKLLTTDRSLSFVLTEWNRIKMNERGKKDGGVCEWDKKLTWQPVLCVTRWISK